TGATSLGSTLESLKMAPSCPLFDSSEVPEDLPPARQILDDGRTDRLLQALRHVSVGSIDRRTRRSRVHGRGADSTPGDLPAGRVRLARVFSVSLRRRALIGL